MIIDGTNVGNLMARKKSSKRKYRRSTKLSLTGLAETLIIGSAATKMFFGVNLPSFVTGVTYGSDAGTGFYPGGDGATRITLPELAGINSAGQFSVDRIGGVYGANSSFTDAVMRNVRTYAVPSIMTAVVTPIAFRFGKKIFRKPLSTIRKSLKGTGVTV